MNKIIIILLVFAITACHKARTVKGTVQTKSNATPVPSATLTLLERNNGNSGKVLTTTITDSLGKYTLTYGPSGGDEWEIWVNSKVGGTKKSISKKDTEVLIEI